MAAKVHRSAANGEGPSFDRMVERYGEDPARFLSVSTPELALARIQGIQDTELVEAWRAVELNITDGGRDVILDALDERKEVLGSGD